VSVDDQERAQLHLRPDADAPQPRPLYSNYIQANFTPEDFTLRFGWYAIPALAEPPEGPLVVDVEPMARIVIPLNLMKNLIALLQRQLQAYEESFGEIPPHPNKPDWLKAEMEAE
jgi:hypothetical protein